MTKQQQDLHQMEGDLVVVADHRRGFYATENRVSREREILLRLLEEPMSGLLVEGSKAALPTPNGGPAGGGSAPPPPAGGGRGGRSGG